MTESNKQLDELFEQQAERDQQIINEVGENLKQVFTDPQQNEVIFDLYQQVYKLNNDVQELNHANIFLNSYVDAFHQLLVGEGKLLSEDEFREKASEAYHYSLQTIMNLSKEGQPVNE